ncbi:MAG TPA: flagellar biosynthetic protein FliO [Pyrinomonadaceae bacterium]|nr:flagellar biosynthetic protein FliO [Pyrinomonadaceae bacterium]
MLTASLYSRTLAAALWLRQDWGLEGGGGGANFFLMLVQTLLALGLVCGLAYVIFRWLLPRLSAVGRPGGMVRVVERAPLDARNSLYVVEVAGRWLLVASSEKGVELVSELDAASAGEAERAAVVKRPSFGGDAAAVREAFSERLARVMNRKGDGR